METLSLQLEEIRLGLGRFKHHMEKEIYEQPEALENTMKGRVKKNEASENLEVGHGTALKQITPDDGMTYDMNMT